jgi:hypothetical protein
MTWHLTNIPKIAYFFWGTQEFPWVRYLTLETFRKHHPDWQMILHKKPILDDYSDNAEQAMACWDKLEKLGIQVEDIDIEDELGITFPVPYITIFADIYRYIVLNKTGGFYSDMDCLYWKSLEDCPFNDPRNVDVQTFMLNPPYHHFILSQPYAPVLRNILYKQIEILPTTKDRILDTTGCTQYVSLDGVKLLPMETTEENFDGNGPKNEHAIALNWHGSGTYGKYRAILESDYMDSDHPLAAVIRYCLHGDTSRINQANNVIWIQRGE